MVAHVRPNEKDKMQNGMEYACLYFNRGSDESFNIEFYDKNANRKTDLMRGISHADVLHQMGQQGWEHLYGTGDGEGVMNYFQRPISPTNDPNWLPIVPESAPKPPVTPKPVIDKRQYYMPRPKWSKNRTGEQEDGVEYMEVVFHRNFEGEGLPAEIITYGKGKKRTSQKIYMGEVSHDNYLKDLEKDGWYEVHSTGNSEGILTYLERQLIVNIQRHSVLIGGKQRIIKHESSSLFTEVIEDGASKRQTINIQTLFNQSITDGWSHLATHTSYNKTAYILGRDGHVMSSEYITPEHHAQLPTGARITRIEELEGELKVSAYDNQKVDNLRNQKKSLAEFVATMTKNNDWQLVYEAQEAGHQVIYLGRIIL